MRMGGTGNSVMAALGVMKDSGPVSKAWLPPSLKTTIMSSLEHQGRTTGKVEMTFDAIHKMVFLCVLGDVCTHKHTHTHTHTHVSFCELCQHSNSVMVFILYKLNQIRMKIK